MSPPVSASTNITTGAATNKTRYPRGTSTRHGAMTAASASTIPVMAIVVPITVPSATLLRSSRFSTRPNTRSSNSIPVNTTAMRNSETAHRLATPTR
ncbi:hypothetical protein [Amycolatopsis jiangsuensis]|uniref:Uncharacterized protein n=1 Tax=Amycolatopsis jiangsuensis TaxID=1181879 RepID=A0A840IQ64_9PSEU|nr:hypothetical protein [Amycolatopsis jiangsuensis]MBB4683174.1 hypothetical protein [Amycolatopsis jiangsuensis]